MESIQNLPDFLRANHLKKDDARQQEIGFTHARIPQKDKKGGGSYFIEEEHMPKFWSLYYNHVFVNKSYEYLTERQLKEDGPIMIDLDFRYDYHIENKQHNEETVVDIISDYLDVIEQIYDITTLGMDCTIPIYVMEKRAVNRVEEKQVTKDGIHIIIGIKSDQYIKTMIRNKVLGPLSSTLTHLPLINNIDTVVDDGVAKGTTGWQLYGSRKPEHGVYELVYYYEASLTLDEETNKIALMLDPKSVAEFNANLKDNIPKLSARYSQHPKMEINENVATEYNALKEGNMRKNKSRVRTITPSSSENTLLSQEEEQETGLQFIPFSQISNQEMLENQLKLFLDSLQSAEHYIRETHEFTQILPEKFYEPGSHELNTKIAFALKNTDPRLFLSWVLMRSKASDFNWAEIPYLKKRWDLHLNSKADGCVVTRRTIMYYAKQENPEEYQKIIEKSVDYYVNLALKDGSDWDLAMVTYQMFKDKYVCANIENKIWYQFRDHRWNKDKGASLRKVISVEVYKKFDSIRQKLKKEYKAQEQDVKKMKAAKKKNKDDTMETDIQELEEKFKNTKATYDKIDKIATKLKSTGNKNNLLTEASTLFYDPEFTEKADSDPMLLCFTNGVWDFTAMRFRDGAPQDYITKCTNINYIPFHEIQEDEKEQIIQFMEQLFPLEGLNRYMWQHLASCLVGGNKNQTFNIYLGKGSNGKSKLTELMSLSFGDYKGTVPITLVTEKRNGIGVTSSEVLQLKGVRYAVMQEPNKNNCKLNEGVMKELTGGDPIVARGLYKESETFVPQLNLVVCSNILFEIESNDAGTWRRIRVCKFMSKFVDTNDIRDEDDKYVFNRDYDLDRKLKVWSSAFMSMLINMYCETKGLVEDCSEVLEESKKYQQTQNMFDTYFAECLEPVSGDEGPKKYFNQVYAYGKFKEWVTTYYGWNKNIKRTEFVETLEKKYGPQKKGYGWCTFKYVDDASKLDIDAEL